MESALASDAAAVAGPPMLAQFDQFQQVVLFAEPAWASSLATVELVFEPWGSAPVAECSLADPDYDLPMHWNRRSVPKGLNRRPQLSQSV